ncbi:MAG TPA: hypothetical protein VIY48_22085 [Candidatus Paceibacterota bacterium]
MPANPGSPEAKRLGCTCPTLDNSYGEGAIVDGKVDPSQFYIAPDCELHLDKRKLTTDEIDSAGTS